MFGHPQVIKVRRRALGGPNSYAVTKREEKANYSSSVDAKKNEALAWGWMFLSGWLGRFGVGQTDRLFGAVSRAANEGEKKVVG